MAMKSAATEPAARVDRLRERIIDAPPAVCVERARYLTQSMAANWDKHPLTRMSLAVERILDNISVIIRDDELIVGCRTSKLKGAPLFPENKSRWIEGDLETLDTRFLQAALIDAAEKRELLDDILPFWRGRTVEERLEQALPPEVAEDMDKYVFTMILEITYGVGHFTIQHSRVLQRGLAGLIADAETRLNALPAGERDGEKGLFYEAAIRSMRAAVRFANRYAARAEAMAEKERDPRRAEELREIARVCRRVPEHPAESFREAAQSVYFIHLVTQIESGGNSVSLGRIDQFLRPYYEADARAGRITPDEARELLSLLYLKTNEIWNVLEEAFIPGGEGAEGKTTQNVTVGGVGPDGADATSELSHIALDAYADVRTVQPNLSVRIGPDAPNDFFMKAVRYAADGILLHLFNDRVVVKSLQRAGHAIEDARDYGVVGCVEPNAQGKTFGSTFAVQLSGAKCLELALSNGVDNTFGYRCGLETGDPAEFGSFEEVWNAYSAQVGYFLDRVEQGMMVLDETISEMVPSPFASSVVDSALERGIDLTRGGAVYNSTGVQLIGFANVVDSLHAIKKAVYEDRIMTLGELAERLADDWDGAEDKRRHLLLKVPKYGNDNDEVDAMAARVLEHFCVEVSRRRNFRGGAFWPGVFSVGFHIAMGSFAAAGPDGRRSGDVLGNGATPTNGNALQGPTAVINSVTKLPLELVYNGANLNMRFNQQNLSPENLAALMKAYFDKGGYQVQFNMTDSATLRDAKANPERHRDLCVRVSGYSALFTGLSETAQDEIIARTEYCL